MVILLSLLTECAHACQGMGKGQEVAKWPCAFEVRVTRYGVQVLAMHSRHRHVLEGVVAKVGMGGLFGEGVKMMTNSY